MPGLGPRVGGAHVDVNLKFDDKSINKVGKQIHKQLSKLGGDIAKVGERNREIYQAIGRDSVVAWRSLLGAIVAGGPLIGSILSGLAGAATILASALYSTVQASFGFAPLLLAIGVAAGTAYLGLSDFFKAVKSGELEGLTPSAKAAAQALRGLNDEFESLRDVVQEKMFKGLSDDISKLGTTLFPVLEKGLGKMAEQLNLLIQDMLDYVNSAQGLKTIGTFLDNMAEIFGELRKAVVPFLDGFLKVMNALSPAAKRLAERITEIALKFQEWASAPGFAKKIDDQMKKAEKTAGLLIDVLVNVWKALTNVFTATNPAANEFLTMLGDVTQKFLDWTSSVEGQNAIAKWAEQSVDVMRQFGKTAEAVFKVIAELADPAVIINFLKTVEGAFEILGKLPLDKMVEAFVKISEALQPVSSFFLAIIIAGASLNILLGGLIGQFGGLFSILFKVLQFRLLVNIFKNTGGGAATAAGKTGLLTKAWQLLVKIFNKIKGAVGSVVGIFTKTSKATGDVATKASKLAGAFKPVMSILGKFAKFAGPVGLAIWIGSIIAGSEKLQDKFGKLWDAIKEVGSSLKTAFEEIGAALKPLAPVADAAGKAFGFIFDILDKIAEIAIGVVLDAIIYGFQSLANVIKGVGKIIAGFINVLVGLFTLDFGKVWDGLKQMASGILPLLEGLFGLFISFFAPARLAKLGLTAMKGLLGGLLKAAPGILSAVGKFVLNILKWFVQLTPKLLAMGAKAFGSLISSVAKAAPGVLMKVGKLVTDVIVWFAKLPVKLLALGIKALQKLAQAVISGAPKVIAGAAKIYVGFVSWILKLPGKLLTLGQQAITKLASAVSAGITKLRTIAGKIVQGVLSFISQLPGKLFTLGQNTVTRLANAVQTGVGKLKTIAGNIKDAIFNAIKALPGEMLSLGKNIIGGLVNGLTSALGKLKDVAGKIGGIIKGVLPGSPVESGPLKAWNRGSGATGGGRNVIDAITKGLQNTDPIKKAMGDVAKSVSGAMPAGGSVTNSRSMSITIQNPQQETASDSLTRTTRNLAYLGLA